PVAPSPASDRISDPRQSPAPNRPRRQRNLAVLSPRSRAGRKDLDDRAVAPTIGYNTPAPVQNCLHPVAARLVRQNFRPKDCPAQPLQAREPGAAGDFFRRPAAVPPGPESLPLRNKPPLPKARR